MDMACLGDDTIAAMLDGRLADASARDARVHIGHCDACRELVAAAIRSPPTETQPASHSSTTLHTGAIFAERYQIERVLGEGGMGQVFEAKQLGLERRVAIKVLRPELARDAVALARFHREARLAASLDSSHVVRIYDLGVLDTGEPYLVMEYLDGEDLATVVERGPIKAEDATRWIAAACEAIGEAHSLGIVHRDIKPSNLFLARGGRLVVLDFGLAKLSGFGSEHVTHAGTVLGSPRYIAPEQILGARDVDARADIWSLGATLYHLVTGRPPFPEPNVDALFGRILSGQPPPLDGMPPVLANTIARAMSRDPAARFASAGEFALAVRARPPDLDDRFEIVELLGEGSHGTVFRARRKRGGGEVAIKVLRGDAQHIRDRFAREAAIVQRLEHPNTVRLYESSVANDTPYMVFELVRGRTLASELYRGPLLPARVARIASQVLKALLEAHALGIVHRDITPANILLVDYAGDPDFVKLLDFGVAVDAESARLTQTGQILGTPRYMAPEQVSGGVVDGRTDLYALGLVMAEALAGAPVFGGDNAMAVWMQQASPNPVPLPYAVTAGPFGALIAKATTKQPNARFASAREMLAALEGGPNAQIAFSQTNPTPAVAVARRPRSSRIVGVLVASTIVLATTTVLLAVRPWAKSATSPAVASGSDPWNRPPDPSVECVGYPIPCVKTEPTPHIMGFDSEDALPPAPDAAPVRATSNLDATRLAARLQKLGWAPVEITHQDFPGCHHTRMRLDAGTFAKQPRQWGEVYVLECESEAYATSEGARLRHGFPNSWVLVDGITVAQFSLPPPGVGFATEKASKELADALASP